VHIVPVQGICGQLTAAALDRERVILLFSKPADVLRALKAGLDCPALNIGGMHYVPGKRKLMDVLAVDDSDIESLKEIAAMGIKIDVRAVPTQRAMPLDKVFSSCHV
jgi:PTS system mannose-specific IIB component